MRKTAHHYIFSTIVTALLLVVSPQIHADMYKYLKPDGSTLLTDMRMRGKSLKLLKVYKIDKSAAYKSSLKKTVKKSSNWKKAQGKHSKYGKKRHKKTRRKYSSKTYKNLVDANGRDNGIIVGCNSPSHLSKQARKYKNTIKIYSRIYKVDEELVHAIVRQESCFNEGALSRVGAIGLMQLMPQTSLGLGINDPWNPEHNIQGGIKYIAQMLDMFDGNSKLAIAAYNAGPGNVNKYRGIPPFNETRNYVKKVYGEYQRLKTANTNKELNIQLAVN